MMSVRINPAVLRDGVIGGTFCPTDGFIAPLQVLKGYLAAALGRVRGWNGTPRSPACAATRADRSSPWKPLAGRSPPGGSERRRGLGR